MCTAQDAYYPFQEVAVSIAPPPPSPTTTFPHKTCKKPHFGWKASQKMPKKHQKNTKKRQKTVPFPKPTRQNGLWRVFLRWLGPKWVPILSGHKSIVDRLSECPNRVPPGPVSDTCADSGEGALEVRRVCALEGSGRWTAFVNGLSEAPFTRCVCTPEMLDPAYAVVPGASTCHP